MHLLVNDWFSDEQFSMCINHYSYVCVCVFVEYIIVSEPKVESMRQGRKAIKDVFYWTSVDY